MTFVLRKPAEDELRFASRSWLEPLKPCLFTHWPEPYKRVSFRTESLILTEEDQASLRMIFEDGDAMDAIAKTTLPAKLTDCLARFPDGAFVKLESRSPKDNYWGEGTRFRTCSWRDIVHGFYSERILDDLARYQHLDVEPCRMLFREWQIIPRHEEFRCFIRGGRIAGISQYHYSAWDDGAGKQRPLYFRKVASNSESYKRAILAFLAQSIIPNLLVENLVVDVWIGREGARLIETNPYGLSDPCLFSYKELEAASEEFRLVTRESAQGEAERT